MVKGVLSGLFKMDRDSCTIVNTVKSNFLVYGLYLNKASEDSRNFFFFLSFCLFLGSLPQHMEVPRLGVELEL